ncbi:MAG TPA: catalase [Cyclobacteriaceae bacterium]|nr:catalase [Cyclobacteriaceae bacterium]MCB9239404.1 catalase [Flammeovirgaceae bacterium]MCB0499671.1 catalase [Cyclobacteriaceae bacterium]MCO5271213.1 catalase [Cyclobacteriaceae bacterium]MCW5902581.1 catalase [Cyclobacteriaceae bacterium]
MKDPKKKLTTSSGSPYVAHEDTMSVGPRGPLLLQDYIFHEKMAHFNRERIPERVVHAKGSGAYGTFTVTHDISQYTKAKVFNKVGKKTRVFVRFSTVGGEKGSADTERDPRGFAVKFYTEEGNWDLVGNNTPVFFIKDPKKFDDFIHTQKRDPKTNCKSPNMLWDYWSLNPESLHQVMILMSDRGTPYSYRHMNGYGSHTFSFLNKDNERFWVKFHFKTVQGIKNFTDAEATAMKGKDPDWAQRDLVESIEKVEYPKWKLKVQIMPEAEAKSYRWNPFDLTKVWPHKDYPLMEVGEMELNEVPANYFADVEQSAFAPAHVVDGIGYSPDKMLQGRLLSYPDAHRYRLGANYEQLPVNRCPYMVNNYQRDGAMRVDGNGGSSPNYFPNSFDDITVDTSYKQPAWELESNVADWYDRNAEGENDHFTQPGDLFRLMDDQNKKNTISNIVGAMSGISGPKKQEITHRQLCHWYRADENLGMAVAKGLGVNIDEVLKSLKGHPAKA